MQRSARMKRELEMLTGSPPHGISCWAKEDSLEQLEAQILGGEGTPYEGGVFKLDIQIPERYPFEPPKIRFVTPIYHPNIDNAGRICLDSLKMPPKGAWKPALNISTMLTTIQLLMAEPNPEDPLMTEISDEFKFKRPQFTQNAKEWTKKYAMQDQGSGASKSTEERKPKSSKQQQDSSSSTESESDSEEENVTRPIASAKRRTNVDNTNVLRENVKKLKS